MNLPNSRTDRKTNQLSQMMHLLNLPQKISLIRISESAQSQESPMVVKDNTIEHPLFLVVDKSLKVMMVPSTGINKQSSN